jgi:hypothetical protein
MIVLTDDYVVTTNSHNYILMRDKHKRGKKGEPLYDVLGYYGSLNSAIIGAKEHCFRERISNDTISLTQAIDISTKVNAEFSDLLNRSFEK